MKGEKERGFKAKRCIHIFIAKRCIHLHSEDQILVMGTRMENIYVLQEEAKQAASKRRQQMLMQILQPGARERCTPRLPPTNSKLNNGHESCLVGPLHQFRSHRHTIQTSEEDSVGTCVQIGFRLCAIIQVGISLIRSNREDLKGNGR